MNKELPTIDSTNWSCCDFLDSIHEAFKPRNGFHSVKMYFYGATTSGWREIRNQARQWLRGDKKRKMEAYIGTDHALTEPDALSMMKADGVNVSLLTCYSGIFHPKLVVFRSAKIALLLSGSNNLTKNGLSSNIEFATAITVPDSSNQLKQWELIVHESSEPLTTKLIKDYSKQREGRKKALQAAEVPWQFTWNKRKKPERKTGSFKKSTLSLSIKSGCLIYEVMPKETGQAGSQIQILKKVATDFFGLPDRIGASKSFNLTNATTGERRELKMTYNVNATMRLSIHEASYTERPCFILFNKETESDFNFTVVSEALEPYLYQELDTKLGQKNINKRRFTLVSADLPSSK